MPSRIVEVLIALSRHDQEKLPLRAFRGGYPTHEAGPFTPYSRPFGRMSRLLPSRARPQLASHDKLDMWEIGMLWLNGLELECSTRAVNDRRLIALLLHLLSKKLPNLNVLARE